MKKHPRAQLVSAGLRVQWEIKVAIKGLQKLERGKGKKNDLGGRESQPSANE